MTCHAISGSYLPETVKSCDYWIHCFGHNPHESWVFWLNFMKVSSLFNRALAFKR